MAEEKTYHIGRIVLCFFILCSALGLGLLIGYFIGAHSVGIALLKEVHRTSDQSKKQTMELETCWSERADSTTDHITTISRLINSAVTRMSGEFFPNTEAIKELKTASDEIQWTHKAINEPCSALFTEYTLPKLPWAVQMMVDNNWITAKDLGQETVLPE